MEDADKITRVITEEIPAKVSADKAYQNAQDHSDKQNARIEHDRALQRVMLELLHDHTELFKQFSDNASFRNWLSESNFGVTYRGHAPDNYGVRRVFFATDRAPTSMSSFGSERADEASPMSYGHCDVSIPHKHKKGEVERPVWLRLEFQRGSGTPHCRSLGAYNR